MSLRDVLKANRAKKAAEQQASQAAPAPNGKPGKNPQTHAIECDKRVVLTFSCGHKIGARYIQGSKCPACQGQTRKQRAAKLREKRGQQAQQTTGRLPHGATIAVLYDALTQRWTGSLTVCGRTFTAERGGVFALLRDLDTQFRAACPEEAAAAAEAGKRDVAAREAAQAQEAPAVAPAAEASVEATNP